MKNILFLFFTLFFTLLFLSFLSCLKTNRGLDLVVALGGNPDSLDPHKSAATLTTQVTRSIYDTLVEPDLSPLLSSSWYTSADKLTWSFVLRDDVVFHNGDTFDAADVVKSITRILDTNTQSPFKKQFSIIKDVKAAKKYRVDFILHKPYSGLLALLGDGHAVIMPKALIATKHNFDREPVGTGPFIFTKWIASSSIVLDKNKSYFLKNTPNKIIFLIISDVAAQVQAMSRSEIDVVAYIIEPEKSQLKKLKHIKIIEQKGATILVLAMNTRNPPLSSLEFRNAVTQTVDKPRLLKDAYGGGSPTTIFWPQGTVYSAQAPTEYNPQKAKIYFKQYFENHVQNKPLVITVPTIYLAHVRAAQIYQQMFADVGLKTTIELVDWATWLSRVYKKAEFDFTIIGHTGKIHPDQRLTNFGKGNSYVGYKNSTFVSIVEMAKNANSLEESYQLYKQAFIQMSKAQPFVFVGQNIINIAHNSRITNIKMDSTLATFDFRNVVFHQ